MTSKHFSMGEGAPHPLSASSCIAGLTASNGGKHTGLSTDTPGVGATFDAPGGYRNSTAAECISRISSLKSSAVFPSSCQDNDCISPLPGAIHRGAQRKNAIDLRVVLAKIVQIARIAIRSIFIDDLKYEIG